MSPEPTTANAVDENERKAKQFREAIRATEDGKPEGTAESLERCANMLDTYAPDSFPANEHGQIHFARAMMESVADEIRAFLPNVAALTRERDAWKEKAETVERELAEAGVRGSQPPGTVGTIPALLERCHQAEGGTGKASDAAATERTKREEGGV